jgi:glycosyltransferase involved in cell wall biosynthesis
VSQHRRLRGDSIPPRLGIVVSHPIQYQAPLYRALAQRGQVTPHVFFMTNHGVNESYDPGFGRPVRFDVPLTEGYSHEFVPNRSPLAFGHPLGTFNPGLPEALQRADLSAVVIHGWAHFSMWIAYAAATKLRIPYFIRAESQIDRAGGTRPTVRNRVLGPVLRHASGCMAIGTLNRDFYRSIGVDPERIFWAPYSVDTKRFERDGSAARCDRTRVLASLGLEPDNPTVLFAAKLQPHKRPLDCVEALDRCGRPINLIVVGDGILRVALEHAASERPWMKTVGFANQQEIAKWYGVADIFVLPSDHEPWGLAVNEAMAAGAVPVVSRAVGCAPDLVSDVGWIFPTGNPDALARCLLEAIDSLSDDARRRRIKERSDDFSVEVTCAGYEEAVMKTISDAG